MIRTLIAAIAAGALFAGAASAAIVQNGSFELDPGTAGYNGGSYGSMNWDIWASLPGWTSDAAPGNNKGIEVQTKPTVGLNPQDGKYYVELDSNQNSSMTQTVLLGLGKHQLSFYYSPRTPEAGTNGIGYAIAEIIGANGTINGPATWYGTEVGKWTLITMDFLVETAGSYTLRFAANTASDSFGGFIDDVSIVPVPVPAAGLLMIGALGGLAALRRRKTA